MTFFFSDSFRGPPDGPDGQVSEASKDFDEIARIMAENGRCWEQRTTRWVDMQVSIGSFEEIRCK
jgi:hypothetical protein